MSNSNRGLSSSDEWSANQYLNWGGFHLNELHRNGWGHPAMESRRSPSLNGSSVPTCGMEIRNGISTKALETYGCFVKLKQCFHSDFFEVSYKFLDLNIKNIFNLWDIPKFPDQSIQLVYRSNKQQILF